MMINHPLFYWLLGYEAKRRKALALAKPGPLKDFLSVPFPAPETPFNKLDILSVDFETTGLHAVNDKLLSVGCIDMKGGQIKLSSSYHQIINTKRKLCPNNVVIHQITDQQQEQGQPLAEVVESLLSQLAGKVMLVHFARIERQFLRQACIELYGLAPPFPMIDTLMVSKRMLDRRDVSYHPSTLRLAALRERYHLPEHFAHNALNDAIATAELLLAQVHHMPQAEPIKLQDILL